MKPYDVNNFWNNLRNDIWVLKSILDLPTNPPTEMGSAYDEEKGITTHFVHHIDDICMDAKREAVQAYRKQLAPIVFTLTQKIYAEIFRLVLGESGIKADKKQFDIERKINHELQKSPTSLVISPVFKNLGEFEEWWGGHYKYSDFREARNQITHDFFFFDGNLLKVENKQGVIMLNWTTEEVFSFTESVLARAKEISTISHILKFVRCAALTWPLPFESFDCLSYTYCNFYESFISTILASPLSARFPI